MNENQTRTAKKNRRTNPFLFAVQLGFFAGLIWGGLRWFVYVYHFTAVTPALLVEPFYKHSYLETTQGQLLGWIAFILFSIAASLLYTIFFKKVPGPWLGIGYGALWWAVLYVWVGPMMYLVPPVHKTTWNTIYTEVCIMVLWGLFIGYTVAMEFTDERLREPGEKESMQAKQQESKAATQEHEGETGEGQGDTHLAEAEQQPST
ncbi:YqhR family membrane protein [Paenibacillus sp. 481]|uniref:YqhR family membrane protein n=1 Tax=Paenibacillus sp. 481 TaxID=2835869 RepID=UPI001E3905FC|nr:YqhR family membrane protein [Paenibacillus sp. 481]UHA72860.1 hypothetical protein KIK04_19880 [Paenibacillus sp. 481]